VSVGGATGQDAILVRPQTFMNLSGSVLPKLFERFETNSEQMIAVYDDIALPLGKLRIRQKGSAGGHNGVKSLISSAGSDAFLRVRVGILPERPIERLHDFVLSRVAKRDRELVDRSEAAAADAVEALLKDGPEKAMGSFNRLDLREAKEE
jgi:PTH1 family peptidyl-tRNA hydrolase